MAEVYNLQNAADKQRLIEKFSGPTNGNKGRPPKAPYVERKMLDARARGLFNTKIDFSTIRHRILVTEVASAAQAYLSDPISSWTKFLPDSGIHHEWFLNTHIYRSPVLILSDVEDLIFTTLTSGLTGLPSSKLVEVSLLLSSEFDDVDEAREFLLLMGKTKEPRLRQAEKLLAAARDPILRSLMNGEDHSVESAVYLFNHKLTNDPHELWRLLSGELIIASCNRCRLPGRSLYLLMPKKVYEDASAEHQVVEFYDFDLVTDPVQTWR